MRTLIVLSLIAGCVVPNASAKKPVPVPVDAPVMTGDSETVIAMHRHLALTDDLRQAVIRGDIAAARDAARRLSTLPPLGSVPHSWGPWLVSIKDSAARVDDSWDLEAAARTTGEIGRACGSCHREVGANVPFKGAGHPGKAGEGLEAHMAHHDRSVELMWQGLVVPDDTRFARAAKALAAARLSEGDAANDLDARIHDLAAYGARLNGIAARADTYGAILTTCQSCHTLAMPEGG